MSGYSRGVLAQVDFVNLKREFGAVGNDSFDDTTALLAANASSNNVIYVPAGIYRCTSPIVFTSGKTWFTVSRPERWRSGVYPVQIKYSGTGSLISLAPAGGTGIEGVYFVGIHFDGTDSSGNVDGISLDASAAGATYIEGVFFEGCAITNFPRYQVRSQRTVFDVKFIRTTIHNRGRAADNLIHVTHTGVGGAPGQWDFDNCWLAPYTAEKWAFFAGKDTGGSTNAISEVVFRGGTIAPYDTVGAGAHGIWVYGGMQIFGTHLEGGLTTQTASIGVRYTGSNGALIFPSMITSFGRGVEIGNPNVKTTEAVGCHINGAVGGNNYAVGGKDVVIVDGGSRVGTQIENTGYYSTAELALQDDRNTVDSVKDELRLLIAYSSGRTAIGGPLTLAGHLKWSGQSRTTAQFDKTSDTTLANVPGLTVNVEAGRTYTFHATLLVNCPAGGGGGKFAVAGTATATAVRYDIWGLNNTTTVTLHGNATALGTAVAAAVVLQLVYVEGYITVNAAGTLTIQFAQNTSNATASSVLIGSKWVMQEEP